MVRLRKESCDQSVGGKPGMEQWLLERTNSRVGGQAIVAHSPSTCPTTNTLSMVIFNPSNISRLAGFVWTPTYDRNT